MDQKISETLEKITAETGVRLLAVVESGSRAWGFPSPDSDYDVRFIYARPTAEDYLTVFDQKDTMDFPINDLLDINGWDVSKTLALSARSNATPMEWLQSPMVYRELPGMIAQLWEAVAEGFCPRSTTAHYLGLTRGSLHKIAQQGDQQKLKTWFYVLRPLFAAEWIIEKQTIPPMEFAPLRELTRGDELAQIIDDLMDIKKEASESFTMAAIPGLQDTIEQRMLNAQQCIDRLPKHKGDPAELDRKFREIIAP
jgi:predicted nucleotidyltransferase